MGVFDHYLSKEDAILWFALGIAGGWAFRRAYQTLSEFREVTRITTEEKPQDIIGQHTEDAISVDTLGELYNSPNWDIRQASVRILIERAVRSPNLEYLLHNAASKKPQVREQAMTTLAYLAMSNSSRSMLRVPKIYKVVVDALVAYLPESATRPHEPHTDWKLRSNTEKSALTILKHVMYLQQDGGLQHWLDAGLITRWLIHFPFGGQKAKELKGAALIKMRNELLDDIRMNQTDDRDLEWILVELLSVAAARNQLRKYRLMGSYRGIEESWALDPREDYGDPRSYTDVVPTRRNNSVNEGDAEEAEEARARRRRREAVVIGDAGEPLSQDNIFSYDAEPEEFEGFARVE